MGDCAGSQLYEISCADSWGRSVAADVRDKYAHGRKVAIVGHSLGGHAAIVAAQYVDNIAAFVALHPAYEISSSIGPKISGPILFTTGTEDDGTYGGITLASRSQWMYKSATS